MPLDYSFEVDGDQLLVTTRGFDDDINEAVSYGEAIIGSCLENKCSSVLIDESEMTAVLDHVSQYQMVQRLKSLIPYELSIALVANMEHYEDTSFGGMVAENRGVNIRIFTSVEAALEWLHQQQPH